MSKLVDVAKVDDIPPGEARAYEVEGEQVGIFNVDGQFHAINNVCTHEEAPLHEGEVVDDKVICPWHQAEFDLKTGAAECPPAVEGVKTYKVVVSGDRVQVEI